MNYHGGTEDAEKNSGDCVLKVILNAAKSLASGKILRFAQDDASMPLLLLSVSSVTPW